MIGNIVNGRANRKATSVPRAGHLHFSFDMHYDQAIADIIGHSNSEMLLYVSKYSVGYLIDNCVRFGIVKIFKNYDR